MGSVFTYETAYAEAQSLGYTGSLQDFVDSIKGKDGIDGKDGADGIGIKSVTVNEQGNLIVTLTNDSVADCGSVRGPKGDQGEKGDQGVSIVSTAFDENGNTVITYSNGDTQTIEHKWKVCYTLVQANCITDGKVLYECEDCSLVRVVTVAKGGHTEGEWTTDTQPTCTVTGSKHQVCSVCGDTINTETINANGHDYKDQVVDPTCATQGYTLHTCSVCGDNYQDTVVPTNGVHNFQESNVCEYCEQDIADVAVDSYNMSKTADDDVRMYVVPRANGKYDAYIKGTGATKDYFYSTPPFRADGYSDKIVNAYIQKGVTTIGERAFYLCTKLTSVTFEENSKLTTIGKKAFDLCTKLTSVTFEENSKLTTIGNYAFYLCSSLESITIPSSVTAIGKEAFYDCSKLANITVDETNQAYKSIDGNLYSKDGTTLILYAIGKTATSFTVPSSVTTIGEWAFYYCTSLESVTFEENSKLTTIGNYAFDYCTSLKSITIPSSVTTIGESAFYYCRNLTSVTFEENSKLTTIGNDAFLWCTSLKSITIPSSVTTIGEWAFSNCTKLTSVTFEENSKLTTIGNYAFYWCSSLESITIPSSVTTVGEYAFSNCTKLTSVTFEDPNGWYCTETEGATSGTGLTLTDPTENATYLRSRYNDYNWYKSTNE